MCPLTASEVYQGWTNGRNYEAQDRGTSPRIICHILLGAPEGVLAKDALARLSEAITLTDYENGTYDWHADKIVRFAHDRLCQGGLVAFKYKGHWLVSEAGEESL